MTVYLASIAELPNPSNDAVETAGYEPTHVASALSTNKVIASNLETRIKEIRYFIGGSNLTPKASALPLAVSYLGGVPSHRSIVDARREKGGRKNGKRKKRRRFDFIDSDKRSQGSIGADKKGSCRGTSLIKTKGTQRVAGYRDFRPT